MDNSFAHKNQPASSDDRLDSATRETRIQGDCYADSPSVRDKAEKDLRNEGLQSSKVDDDLAIGPSNTHIYQNSFCPINANAISKTLDQNTVDAESDEVFPENVDGQKYGEDTSEDDALSQGNGEMQNSKADEDLAVESSCSHIYQTSFTPNNANTISKTSDRGIVDRVSNEGLPENLDEQASSEELFDDYPIKELNVLVEILPARANRALRDISATPRLRDIELRPHRECAIKGPHCNQEAALCQTRGQITTVPCQPCDKGNGVFIQCIVIPGEFNEACGNCR